MKLLMMGRCKFYRKKFAKSGNTSNLRTRLKNNHKAVHCQLQSPSAKVTSKPQEMVPLAQTLPYGHQSKRFKELTQVVAYYKMACQFIQWKSLGLKLC